MIQLLFAWIFYPFICGVANRIRGGWLSYDIKRIISFWGSTVARLFVSFIVSIPTLYIFSIYKFLVFFLLLYLGFIFGWSKWQYMKHPLHDTIFMSFRGLVLTLPSGLISGLYKFAFCGLLMGLCYYVPTIIKLHHKDHDGYVWVASDWGELLIGIVLGFFLILNVFQHI